MVHEYSQKPTNAPPQCCTQSIEEHIPPFQLFFLLDLDAKFKKNN